MNKLLLILFFLTICIYLAADELVTWVSLGESWSLVSDKDKDMFRGKQIGLNGIRITENNMFFGGSIRYIEKGWIENDTYFRTNFFEALSKVGFAIHKIDFYPFLGIATTYVMNSSLPASEKFNLDIPISIGFDYISEWLFQNMGGVVISIDYNIGTRNLGKNYDFKYNSLNLSLGLRF